MPSNDWTEGRYLRQRRNLNAMSIALLVYVIGGGSVKNGSTTQLPGGFMSISLERPSVLIALAWASLLYFMWRYWLASNDLRHQIKLKRQNAYHWTPYVRRLIERTIKEHDLISALAVGTVDYRIGKWTLSFGQVQKKSSDQSVVVPDRQLPFIPFVFLAWLAELKAAWVAPEFSEYYTPFFLAWVAIESAFVWPAFS